MCGRFCFKIENQLYPAVWTKISCQTQKKNVSLFKKKFLSDSVCHTRIVMPKYLKYVPKYQVCTYSTREDACLILPLIMINANSFLMSWNNFQSHSSVFKPNGFFSYLVMFYLGPGRVPVPFTFSICTLFVCLFPNPCGFIVAVGFFSLMIWWILFVL